MELMVCDCLAPGAWIEHHGVESMWWMLVLPDGGVGRYEITPRAGPYCRLPLSRVHLLKFSDRD